MLKLTLIDSLYLTSLKECATVIDMLKIHPISTLLSGEGDALSSTVHMSDEQSVALSSYLTDDGNLNIDKYFTAIYGKTKAA